MHCGGSLSTLSRNRPGCGMSPRTLSRSGAHHDCACRRKCLNSSSPDVKRRIFIPMPAFLTRCIMVGGTFFDQRTLPVRQTFFPSGRESSITILLPTGHMLVVLMNMPRSLTTSVKAIRVRLSVPNLNESRLRSLLKPLFSAIFQSPAGSVTEVGFAPVLRDFCSSVDSWAQRLAYYYKNVNN